MKHVPCWKHGGFLESSLVERISQWYLNHFHSLHQPVTVVGQRLHLMRLQSIQIVFHQIADGVYDLKVSRRMWHRRVM